MTQDEQGQEPWYVRRAPGARRWLVVNRITDTPLLNLDKLGEAELAATLLNALQQRLTEAESKAALADEMRDYLKDWLPWPNAGTHEFSTVLQFAEGLLSWAGEHDALTKKES